MEVRNCEKCYQMTNHRIDIDKTETCLKCGWKRKNRKFERKRDTGEMNVNQNY